MESQIKIRKKDANEHFFAFIQDQKYELNSVAYNEDMPLFRKLSFWV